MQLSKIVVVALFISSFALSGWGQISAVRGPYLQKATQTSIVIRWMANDTIASKVVYGQNIQNLSDTLVDSTLVLDHTLEITGLQPATRYYYELHTLDSLLVAGSNLYFETLPEVGTEDVYTFLALGDAGQGNDGQRNVSDALVEVYGNHHDGFILLGDNAYWSGTQAEYQLKFFDGFYNTIFENTVIWPSPGNHDYYGASVPMSIDAPYFDIFNLPTQGECGGVPSGTEQIYSYDIGNVHFVALDSYGVDRTGSGYMSTWLENDLEQNELPWIIAYWHHPPYSKGSHDSDNPVGGEHELVEMREHIVPILEKYDVDLVLTGHSHSYERSMMIAGHYGHSQSFHGGLIKNGGSGNYPNSCAYVKVLDTVPLERQGSVYSVVGVSGWASGVQQDWPHPIMYSYSNEHLGGMYLQVSGNELVAEFLTEDREIFDRFVIKKEAPGALYPELQNCSWQWRMFPNPGNGLVFLEYAKYEANPADEYVVYDMNGRLIDTGTLTSEMLLDFSNEPSGMYVIQLREQESMTHFKYVKL